MDNKKLEMAWADHKAQVERANRNTDYVQGKNPPILEKNKQRSPDNRIPVPLAKIAVEDMSGYAGRPGDRKVYWEMKDNDYEDDAQEQSLEGEFSNYMGQIYAHNEEWLETAELYNEALIQGVSYEILWVSDKLDLGTGVMTPEFKRVPYSSVHIEYSNDIRPKKLYGLYFLDSKKEEKKYITVYYPAEVVDGEVMQSGYYEKYEQGYNVGKWDMVDAAEYPFRDVPIVEFKANQDCKPLFDAEKPLIDAHDTLLSKSVNEVDRFNAMITLFPGKMSRDLRDKLAEVMMIDDLDMFEADKWPKYLEKNLSGVSDFYRELADRLEKLFHKSVKIPDMTDESFAGNQSGVAIAYKLIGMEFKASLIDAYFNRGIVERDELIKDCFRAGVNSLEVDEYKTVVKAKRNIPIDELSKIQVATQMLGLGISMETILKALPASLVEDAERELKRIESEPETDPLMIEEVEGEINPNPQRTVRVTR